MTEEEWSASAHLEALYGFLKRQGRPTRSVAGRRRLRLLACGCCRLLLCRLPMSAGARRTVDVVEEYADGRVKAAAVHNAWAGRDERPPLFDGPEGWSSGRADEAMTATGGSATSVVYHTTRAALGAVEESGSSRAEARRLLCGLLRDIFTYPAGPPRRELPPAVLRWGGGTAVRLAESAYEQRLAPAGLLDPARLSVLSDALEEAGCSNEVLLAHLRDRGPHVRGCWALDLVLGKS
ncbi:MAG: hypothetical protein ACRC33_01510 [Gemmataceae bacterium]